MATKLLQIRVDDELKEKATVLYASLGLDLSTAIRMFLTRSIMENGIPFSTTLPKEPYKATQAIQALKEISEEAIKNGTSELSEEEIEQEISLARKTRL